MKVTLKIEFDNKEAAKHFATWLCESGEQSYWQWMEVREADEEEEDITALEFHYFGPITEDEPYGSLDFIEDLTIRTTCGRQDE